MGLVEICYFNCFALEIRHAAVLSFFSYLFSRLILALPFVSALFSLLIRAKYAVNYCGN